MQRYNTTKLYVGLERANSLAVLSLQMLTLYCLLKSYDGTHYLAIIIAFTLAYLFADFINGLVHMYMDNNTRYSSIIGPFVSSFHLHHARLTYGRNKIFSAYFYESGTKFWLTAYLIGLACTQHFLPLNYACNVGLVSFGILSSIAEVSHYLCHNASPKNKLVNTLQKYRVLLSKKHHSAHHRHDNINYAFLNGVTDPLLNRISQAYYNGYKNRADKHTSAYLELLKKQQK